MFFAADPAAMSRVLADIEAAHGSVARLRPHASASRRRVDLARAHLLHDMIAAGHPSFVTGCRPGRFGRTDGGRAARMGRMCRNITILRGLQPAATAEEIEAAARQYVRKVSGVQTVSAADEGRSSSPCGGVTDATDRAAGGAAAAQAAADDRAPLGAVLASGRDRLRAGFARDRAVTAQVGSAELPPGGVRSASPPRGGGAGAATPGHDERWASTARATRRCRRSRPRPGRRASSSARRRG